MINHLLNKSVVFAFLMASVTISIILLFVSSAPKRQPNFEAVEAMPKPNRLIVIEGENQEGESVLHMKLK